MIGVLTRPAAVAVSTACLWVSLQPAARAQNPTWSGAYVGSEIGTLTDPLSSTLLSLSRDERLTPLSTSSAYPELPPSVRLARTSLIGAALAGYQYQAGAMVVGLETEISGLPGDERYQASTRDRITDLRGTIGTRDSLFSVSEGTRWLYTLRPRAGVAFGRVLVYGTAGLAAGRTETSSDFTVRERDDLFRLGNLQTVGHSGVVRAGYDLGGGVEYALSSRFTLRANSDYFDLGNAKTIATGSTLYRQLGFPPVHLNSAAAPYVVSQRFNGVTARLGVSCKL